VASMMVVIRMAKAMASIPMDWSLTAFIGNPSIPEMHDHRQETKTDCNTNTLTRDIWIGGDSTCVAHGGGWKRRRSSTASMRAIYGSHPKYTYIFEFLQDTDQPT